MAKLNIAMHDKLKILVFFNFKLIFDRSSSSGIVIGNNKIVLNFSYGTEKLLSSENMRRFKGTSNVKHFTLFLVARLQRMVMKLYILTRIYII